jgi:hypothetical protein
MKTWTKDDALTELDDLIQGVNRVASAGRGSAEHTRWVLRTLKFLEAVFGPKSMYYRTFASIPWRATGSIVIQAWDIQEAIEERHSQAFLKQLDTARGLLQAARDELSESAIDSVYQGKDTPPESSTLLKVINLAERKLRKTIRNAPSNEREVQDAFENLLIGADIIYSRESDSIEYSSKTYIPDFTIKQIDLAIDIKLCARDGREKEIIAEINDDILAYQTKYGNLLFVVYDVGQIRDSDRFGRSFEEHDNVMVRVVKH